MSQVDTPIDTYIAQHENQFLEDLKGWLRIPSISTLPEHISDIRQAAEYAAAQLRAAGLERAEVLPTAGHPLVYGEWLKAYPPYLRALRCSASRSH